MKEFIFLVVFFYIMYLLFSSIIFTSIYYGKFDLKSDKYTLIGKIVIYFPFVFVPQFLSVVLVCIVEFLYTVCHKLFYRN